MPTILKRSKAMVIIDRTEIKKGDKFVSTFQSPVEPGVSYISETVNIISLNMKLPHGTGVEKIMHCEVATDDTLLLSFAEDYSYEIEEIPCLPRYALAYFLTENGFSRA